MSGYWKFNSSLPDEKDFQDLLELMFKRELTEIIISSKWWGNLKDEIRLFDSDNKRLKLNKSAEQRLIEAKLDRAVMAEDSGTTNIAKPEQAS